MPAESQLFDWNDSFGKKEDEEKLFYEVSLNADIGQFKKGTCFDLAVIVQSDEEEENCPVLHLINYSRKLDEDGNETLMYEGTYRLGYSVTNVIDEPQ